MTRDEQALMNQYLLRLRSKVGPDLAGKEFGNRQQGPGGIITI